MLFQQSVEKHRAGDLRGAVELYRRLLAIDGAHIDAQYLLGTALLQLGEFDESIERLQNVIASRPEVADAHNNLGIAYKASGDWEKSARSFEAALRINPEYDQALFNLGTVMMQRNLFADAAKCFRHALRLAPTDQQIRFELAGALKSLGEWAEAEKCYRECRSAGYEQPHRDIHLAFVLARQEKLDAAIDMYREILNEQPEFAEVYSSISYIEERRGRLDEALAAAQRAIELKPDYPEGQNNLGNALRSQHRLSDACAAFSRALELRPDFALAEFNLGTTHLLAGDYLKGWPGYERRAEALGEPPRQFPQPRWAGDPLPGKRLFVFADQGFGDAIQFVRFLQTAKERSQGTVVFECQPELISLFAGLPAIDEITADAAVPPPFDAWISLSSLPGVFGCTIDTIPEGRIDLPAADEESDFSKRRAELVGMLADLSSPRKVGLVWQGNPEQARDVVRSCPLKTFARMFDVDGIDFVSLQTGGDAPSALEEFRADGARILDVGSHVRTFAETSAVIGELDLVVTVDTATAHLAGAVGAPVWTLLSHTPDWRWGLSGEDCPWYPGMRLFRQPAWGDWGGPVDETAPSYRAPDDLDGIVAELDARLEWEWANARNYNNDVRPVTPAAAADDLQVLRRLSLSLVGTIPSLEEIRQFEADNEPNRLRRWTLRYLNDSRFAPYFAERLARAYVSTEGGTFIIFRRDRFVNWLAEQLRQNTPYDVIVREMIASDGLWTGAPQTNFMTAGYNDGKFDVNKLAGRSVRAFLGQRIDCAQCHDHKLDNRWKQHHFEGLAAFYAQSRLTAFGIEDRTTKGNKNTPVEYEIEIPGKEKETRVVSPEVPFLQELLPEDGNRRQRLAGWITHPDNRRFERAAANRIWGLLFGRAYTHPTFAVDDLPDPDDPYETRSTKLLDILGRDFREHDYDLRRMILAITSTRAFRMSSRHPIDRPAKNEAEQFKLDQTIQHHENYWAVFPLSRLRPEQVIGSMIQSASARTIDQNSHLFVRFDLERLSKSFARGRFNRAKRTMHKKTIDRALTMMDSKQLKAFLLEEESKSLIASYGDTQCVAAIYNVVAMPDTPPAPNPHFETIAIVGVGLIGGSIAAAVKARGVAKRVIGVGRSRSRLQPAVDRGLIDSVETDAATAAAGAGVIVFCTPVDRIVDGIRGVLSHCADGTIVTDAGSVKAEICRELAGESSGNAAFVGSHPLAGSEKHGYENADAELFDGRICVVTPDASTSADALGRVSQFWQALGMRVLERSPEEHDRLLAATSHLPHLLAASLATLLNDDNRDFAASGFRDTTRIAASDPELWGAILAANADATAEAVDQVLKVVLEFRKSLAERDRAALKNLFETAKRNRDTLEDR
eukprot:g8355.t1